MNININGRDEYGVKYVESGSFVTVGVAWPGARGKAGDLYHTILIIHNICMDWMDGCTDSLPRGEGRGNA